MDKLTEVTQKFNSLKLNDKVFLSMLKDQPFYGEANNISTIVFGDPEAKNTITIFSNPHCGPCARMHRRIEKLLEDVDNKYRIQYILSSFDSTLDSSCEFFIDINKRFSVKERNKIYDSWFDHDKNDKDNFFKKYSFIAGTTTSEEYQRHLDWKKKTKLQATPTVLFNGYELPELFFQQIEKLVFFTDLEVDPK